MRAQVEFLILPYASTEGRSLLHVLRGELEGGQWDAFYAAVAFMRESAHDETLLAGIRNFAEQGNKVVFTIGADIFGNDGRGSEYRAVETLLHALDDQPSAMVHLYHEIGRTFHPKLYLFANEARESALVIIGSSNWTGGGLVENVEANTLVHLSLGDGEHLEAFRSLKRVFETYWMEAR